MVPRFEASYGSLSNNDETGESENQFKDRFTKIFATSHFDTAKSLDEVSNLTVSCSSHILPSNNSYGNSAEAYHESQFGGKYALEQANVVPQEYADIQKKPLDGMRISLASEADLHQWQILIDGPKGSPYEVRHFRS